MASSSGRALTSDSSISSSRNGVPDDAAADPEVDAPVCDRERADREREVEVAVRAGSCRARPSTLRGRPARAPRCGRWPRSSARRSPSRRGTSPRAARSATRPRGACPRRARRGARRRPAVARVISSGHVTEPGSQTRDRSFRSRSTIITCSAASFSRLGEPLAARRARALDRHRPDPATAAREEELGRGGDDRPAVADERPRDAAAAAAQAARRGPAGSPRNGADRCWTRFTW